MRAIVVLALVLCLASTSLSLPIVVGESGVVNSHLLNASDPSFDHQTSTYHSQFNVVNSDSSVTIRPFFSPGYSLTTVTELIESAESYIKIFTPSFDGWDCGSKGCAPSACRVESFPVFSALLNALHNGIKVSVVVNDYNTAVAAGSIDVRTFLQLNGADVKYYKTTTFMHSKVVIVDGKKVAISSVNFSKNSFTNNREAGAVLSGQDELVSFVEKVFDSDASAGYTKTPQTYSSADMATITDTSTVDVNVPTPSGHSGQYLYKPEDHTVDGKLELYTSPDYARTSLMDIIDSVQNSIVVYAYQITDCDICNKLITLNNNGVDVKVLVSKYIYDDVDFEAAQVCYQTMTNAGLTVATTADYSLYTYSHNKYFIVDGKGVHWSTGNLSPSDYAKGDSFPPYDQSGWQRVNRDFNVYVESSAIVDVFQTVYSQDLSQGGTWSSKYAYSTCN